VRLRFAIRYAEELQLLLGSGSGVNLLGLYTGATAYAAPITVTSPTKIDVLRLAIGQLRNSEYSATGIVLHPNDATEIDLTKDGDGNYIKSDPNHLSAATLWGRPIVETTAISAGTFLVGDFVSAATLYDREDPRIDIATQDQDDFIRNLIKIRCEERLSLAYEMPAAMVKGTFPS
jgi:HK97 family phage major capsid protein